MGNQADPETQENSVDRVELALVAGEDTVTGESVPIRASDGVLQAIIQTPDGEAMTDALASIADDELRVALENDNLANALDIDIEQIGGQAQSAVDVADAIDQIEDALQTTGSDELRSRLFGVDDTGSLQSAQVEALNNAPAAGTLALVTYLARALQSQGQDELVSRITDSTGSQVDPATAALENALKANDADELVSRITDSTGAEVNPDQSPDYPDTVQQQDLIGTGDLTIGPVSVARSEAIMVSANSVDGNTWSASVEWVDSNGNVIQTESATDIGLSGVTQDWVRLVRKAPQVSVTFTDTSGATANNINAYADAHR